MGCSPDDLATVELVWLDSLGFYIRTVPLLPPNEPQTLRLTFLRPVSDEREARSALTMMAQVRMGWCGVVLVWIDEEAVVQDLQTWNSSASLVGACRVIH